MCVYNLSCTVGVSPQNSSKSLLFITDPMLQEMQLSYLLQASEGGSTEGVRIHKAMQPFSGFLLLVCCFLHLCTRFTKQTALKTDHSDFDLFLESGLC